MRRWCPSPQLSSVIVVVVVVVAGVLRWSYTTTNTVAYTAVLKQVLHAYQKSLTPRLGGAAESLAALDALEWSPEVALGARSTRVSKERGPSHASHS